MRLLLLLLAAAGARGAAELRPSVHVSGDAQPEAPLASGRVFPGRFASGWANATVLPPFAPPPRGYEPAQWRRVRGRVALRGWLTCAAGAEAGAPVFSLPPRAWPARDEPFRVAFRGAERALVVGAGDGVARLSADSAPGAWLPLVSLEYDGGADAEL